MVSILVCTYNQENYIGTAIESILSQKTKYGFELLIGDDGSTDNTGRIVSWYAENSPNIVKAFLREENLGATRNGYELAKKAKGKYIAVCDGDDCWCMIDRIDRQVDFLEMNSEYSAVCGKCRLIDDDGNEIRRDEVAEKARFWEFEKEVFTWEDFECWKMPGHASSLLGRNIYRERDASILYQAHDIVGDRTNVLLWLLDGPIYCTKDVVSCYRVCRRSNHHFMALYSSRNLYYEETHLMNYLEAYAEAYGHRLNLSVIKKSRFVAAICVWMKNLSLENVKAIYKIISESNERLGYWKLAIKTVALKLYYWHILRTDRRIDVK